MLLVSTVRLAVSQQVFQLVVQLVFRQLCPLEVSQSEFCQPEKKEASVEALVVLLASELHSFEMGREVSEKNPVFEDDSSTVLALEEE
jgi:hypothetical protein